MIVTNKTIKFVQHKIMLLKTSITTLDASFEHNHSFFYHL